MRALTRRLRLNAADDRGIALIVVLGIGMLMLALVATALTVAVSGLTKTDTDQNLNGATDAAYAGVEEYKSRLATDNTYLRFGNPAASFSATSAVTLPTGSEANLAFGVLPADGWATVPGSTPTASFRYEVDNSQYVQTGVIRLRSTGRVGNVTRTIVANLRQSGFIDYLYFTDYEVQDPQQTGVSGCYVHLWETPTRPSSCGAIQFATVDTIGGPVHSNDTLTICGTTFLSQVTSSNFRTPIEITPSGCPAATYAAPDTGPVYQAPVALPPTNAEMKKETRNDLPAQVPNPGCLYTGPTVITLTADGKMNVKSPWTIKTNVSQTVGIPSTAPAACGTPGTGSGGLGSSAGATINALPANLVYVQNVPTVSSDPNWRSGVPSGFSCVNSNTGWTFGSIGYPVASEITPAGSTAANPAYGCRNGDVFVQGTFHGSMTIAAENYVYVTGDVIYTNNTTDILGLVGNGAVWVWNPMQYMGWYTWPILTDGGREIDAALLSVAHTFQVQNFYLGNSSRGVLTVKGSIAQTFRGPVGLTNGVGYSKNYVYDPRFAHIAPPKFLSPVSSTYKVTQFASVPVAFNAAGAQQ